MRGLVCNRKLFGLPFLDNVFQRGGAMPSSSGIISKLTVFAQLWRQLPNEIHDINDYLSQNTSMRTTKMNQRVRSQISEETI